MKDAVLILDDSLTVRMDLAEAFEAGGFAVIPCETIAAARAVLGERAVAVLVLDVVLPDGDGVDVLREVRGSAGGADAVVLMLSSEAEVKDRVRALRTGADEYVGKPYDRGYVVAKARELLRSRRNEPARSGEVLIIDDSSTSREALRRTLEEAGYAVLVAGSGEEGLRIAADRRPAAIIVDGELPGIDGGTVIRRVRLDAALRGTPCVLLTGSEDGGAELRAFDAGADSFLRKEEDAEVIVAKLAAVMRAAAVTPATATVSLLGPRRILAVDDSETYLQTLASDLRSEGYDVVPARSGEEALELLAVSPVDCILLDLMMPGIGGKETCVRIKAAPVLREIPLIMLTAREDRSAMLEGLGAGADDYVPKSSELDVLRARVRAQIRRKQFEDENRRFREELLRKELEAAEARSARALAETRAAMAEELELKNKELEAFSYSVSHDLRAPLRAIDGFSSALVEDYGDRLEPGAKEYLARVRTAARRMSELIDDLLQLSRVTRAELRRQRVDLAELARAVFTGLKEREPAREVELRGPPSIPADADPGLMRTALENLVGNAWKFSGRRERAEIEIGERLDGASRVFFVRDNGDGFDPAFRDRLFRPFQRLHAVSDFEGTGIGLATVHRIITRHGGRVWADGEPGRGATIHFTLSGGDHGQR